jgi:hypothetical protein
MVCLDGSTQRLEGSGNEQQQSDKADTGENRSADHRQYTPIFAQFVGRSPERRAEGEDAFQQPVVLRPLIRPVRLSKG